MKYTQKYTSTELEKGAERYDLQRFEYILHHAIVVQNDRVVKWWRDLFFFFSYPIGNTLPCTSRLKELLAVGEFVFALFAHLITADGHWQCLICHKKRLQLNAETDFFPLNFLKLKGEFFRSVT